MKIADAMTTLRTTDGRLFFVPLFRGAQYRVPIVTRKGLEFFIFSRIEDEAGDAFYQQVNDGRVCPMLPRTMACGWRSAEVPTTLSGSDRQFLKALRITAW